MLYRIAQGLLGTVILHIRNLDHAAIGDRASARQSGPRRIQHKPLVVRPILIAGIALQGDILDIQGICCVHPNSLVHGLNVSCGSFAFHPVLYRIAQGLLGIIILYIVHFDDVVCCYLADLQRQTFRLIQLITGDVLVRISRDLAAHFCIQSFSLAVVQSAIIVILNRVTCNCRRNIPQLVGIHNFICNICIFRICGQIVCDRLAGFKGHRSVSAIQRTADQVILLFGAIIIGDRGILIFCIVAKVGCAIIRHDKFGSTAVIFLIAFGKCQHGSVFELVGHFQTCNLIGSHRHGESCFLSLAGVRGQCILQDSLIVQRHILVRTNCQFFHSDLIFHRHCFIRTNFRIGRSPLDQSILCTKILAVWGVIILHFNGIRVSNLNCTSHGVVNQACNGICDRLEKLRHINSRGHSAEIIRIISITGCHRPIIAVGEAQAHTVNVVVRPGFELRQLGRFIFGIRIGVAVCYNDQDLTGGITCGV